MRFFVDALGHEWQLDVNYGAKKKVLARNKINLFKISDNRFAVVEDLLSDQQSFFGVLWTLCQPKAGEAGVKDEETFVSRFDPESIDAAEEALVEGLADFLPSRHSQALRKLREIGKAALSRLREIDAEALVDEQMSRPPSSSTSSPAIALP
jgi:hypothetical protein